MEEPVKRTILDLLGNKKAPICQLIIINKISSSDFVFNFLNDYFNNNYVDKVSGFLVVYYKFMVLMIESEEEIVFKICLDLLKSESSGLENAQHFPIHISKTGRFFTRWFFRKIIQTKFNDNEKVTWDDEKIKLLYIEVVEKLYKFSWHCKENNLEETFVDSLLSLENAIEILVNYSQGNKLSEMVKKYWQCLEFKEAEIWPIPYVQEPAIPYS